MNYLSKSRSRNPYSRRVLILLGIFLVGTIIFYFLKPFIISIASPIWKAENVVSRSLAGGFRMFYSRKALIDENIALKERLSSQELELASLASGREQENVLLELLGRRTEEASIAAAVLTHPPQSPYDILIIDAGSRDLVAVGAKTFLPEGPELGVISEVFGSSAKVKLFSTSGEKTNAVLERHMVGVVIEGAGGGNFRIIVPRDTEVERGDRILSAAIDQSLLAVIEEIRIEPTASFKELLARSPVNIFAVRFVLIKL